MRRHEVEDRFPSWYDSKGTRPRIAICLPVAKPERTITGFSLIYSGAPSGRLSFMAQALVPPEDGTCQLSPPEILLSKQQAAISVQSVHCTGAKAEMPGVARSGVRVRIGLCAPPLRFQASIRQSSRPFKRVSSQKRHSPVRTRAYDLISRKRRGG